MLKTAVGYGVLIALPFHKLVLLDEREFVLETQTQKNKK